MGFSIFAGKQLYLYVYLYICRYDHINGENGIGNLHCEEVHTCPGMNIGEDLSKKYQNWNKSEYKLNTLHRAI